MSDQLHGNYLGDHHCYGRCGKRIEDTDPIAYMHANDEFCHTACLPDDDHLYDTSNEWHI